MSSMIQTISVRLTPKASRDKIGETRVSPDGRAYLMVYVTSPAENGKANQAMVKLLAQHFDVSVSQIEIIQGTTSRNKIVRIRDIVKAHRF